MSSSYSEKKKCSPCSKCAPNPCCCNKPNKEDKGIFGPITKLLIAAALFILVYAWVIGLYEGFLLLFGASFVVKLIFLILLTIGISIFVVVVGLVGHFLDEWWECNNPCK